TAAPRCHTLSCLCRCSSSADERVLALGNLTLTPLLRGRGARVRASSHLRGCSYVGKSLLSGSGSHADAISASTKLTTPTAPAAAASCADGDPPGMNTVSCA